MSIPRIEERNGQKILYVNDKPFIMLCGEVHNSSSSSTAYMEPIWQKLKSLNLNSVLLPITWQMLEPEEGRFDFSLVDGLIDQARENGMKLGLLWFGSWKNAQCSYAPAWVKLDKERFPRAEVVKGKIFTQLPLLRNMPYATLSAFGEETARADAKAFAALMAHLREIDGEENTVVMAQVENETGLLGSARERSDLADALFAKAVPEGLAEFLLDRKDTLAEDVKEALEKNAGGSWSEVFGSAAEEAFSAYYTAKFVETVASAGKKEYPLPMSVNCWLPQGGEPGAYPSGGPVARMMEVWQYAAPSIDVFAPDIYVPNFCEVCNEYVKLSNPLFIPEAAAHASAGARELYVVGHHHAMCYSPFGIEDLGGKVDVSLGETVGMAADDPALQFSQDEKQYARLNQLLGQLLPLIAERYGTSAVQAVCKEDAENSLMMFYPAGIKVLFDLPGMITAQDGACLAVQTESNEYLILGCGCFAIPISLDRSKPYMEYLSIEEGEFDNGEWRTLRVLNGDEEMLLINEPKLLKVKVNFYS